MLSSSPSGVTVTSSPPPALLVTGAGPQPGSHCWTVKFSFNGPCFHFPSNEAASVGSDSVAVARVVETNRKAGTRSARRMSLTDSKGGNGSVLPSTEPVVAPLG